MPGFTSAGPDPRGRGRRMTPAEERAEELARAKHEDEMRAIWEARRQKAAERKQAEADALAERRAAQRERDHQRWYEAHPEEWERDQRIKEQREKDRQASEAQKAEQARRDALTPEQRQAEIDARRAAFRADEAKRYEEWNAKQKALNQATENEKKIQDQFRQASGVDTMNPPGSGRFGGVAGGMDVTRPAAPQPSTLPFSERMGDNASAPSKTLGQAVPAPAPVQPPAAAPTASVPAPNKPAPAPSAPATPSASAGSWTPGTATQSAGSAFEEARRANPNLTPSEFFASRPELMAAMQAEQNPMGAWSSTQKAPSGYVLTDSGLTPTPGIKSGTVKVAGRGNLGSAETAHYTDPSFVRKDGMDYKRVFNPRTGKMELVADPLSTPIAQTADFFGSVGEGLADAGKYGLDWLSGLLNDRKVQVNKPTGTFDPNLRGLTYDEAAYGPGMGDMSDRSQAFPGGIIPSLQPRVFATPMVFGPYSR